MARTTYSNVGDPALIRELNDLSRRLDEEIENLKNAGVEAAEAERQYRLAEKQNALWLKEQGYTASMIDKILKGYCADSLFKRDVAKVMYDSAQELINVLKTRIRVLEGQIDREWRG